jgi:hypothetical protein
MNDHKPPTSLDKPPPGDDHANIPMRVTRLEVMVDEVTLGLAKLDAKVDRLDHKIDVGLEKLNDKIDTGLEKLNDKIDAGLEKLNDKIDAGLEKLNDKIDASHQELVRYFNKIYYMIFMFLTAIIGGLLALLAKVIGVF